MLTLSREIHGIDANTLRGYLVRLGGVPQPGETIAGTGWTALIRKMPDYQLGRTSFCCFLVEISGEQEVVENLLRQFDLRIMRPGG